MIAGMIHPAGHRGGQFGEENISYYASLFTKDVAVLQRVLAYLEESERPEIALLQSPALSTKAHAVCFVSSAWSRSYRRVSLSHTQVRRDFHYQCFFTAMNLLAEIGCTDIRVNNLFNNEKWHWDALICLREALANINMLVNPHVSVSLREDLLSASTRDNGEKDKLSFESHRPIAMCPYVMEGLNMCRIFLPTHIAV